MFESLHDKTLEGKRPRFSFLPEAYTSGKSLVRACEGFPMYRCSNVQTAVASNCYTAHTLKQTSDRDF